MEELLTSLENKMKAILNDYRQLKHTQHKTLHDHTALQIKQAAAASRIEGLIAKLKEHVEDV